MDVTHSEAAPATSSDEPIPPPLDFVQATDDDITTAKPRDESSAIVSEPEKTPAPSVIPQNPNPQDEIDKAFIVCSDIIDKPPDDYRLIRQAVLGLQHLSARRSDLRSIVILKLLQIIRDPLMYRSNPRRFAVQSLGYLTYYDSALVEPALQLLTQLLERRGEGSQYVRKAAYMALSRIGRRYPQYQDTLAPLFISNYQDPRKKPSEVWGIVIGIGRLAQSNAQLRTQFAPEFVKLCSHKTFRMRWAGIKGLGHSVCAIGNVSNDEILEEKCYELCMQLLKHGGVEELMQKAELDPEDWKRDDVYLSQYAATQALGLLLRSNPDKWWNRLSTIFGDILLNPKYASMTKAMVMLTYGRIGYYMTPENPYYTAITDLLFELTKNENELVAEPAIYGLCNFALAHEELYPRVKEIMKKKLHLDRITLEFASPEMLVFYLKPWCKLLAKNYNPVLNMCSGVISAHAQGKVAPGAFTSAELQVGDSEINKDSAKSASKPGIVAGEHQAAMETREIASDNNQLWRLCTQYSTPVIESVNLLLTEVSTLDDASFLQNLRELITQYNAKQNVTLDHQGMMVQFDQLVKMDPVLRESAVNLLKSPQVLQDMLWIFNLKTMMQVIASRPSSSSPSMLPRPVPAAPVYQPPVVAMPPPLPVIHPAAPLPPTIDPHITQLVTSVLQQPNGAQMLFQLTNTLPPAQAAQIGDAVKQILGAAMQQQHAQLPQLPQNLLLNTVPLFSNALSPQPFLLSQLTSNPGLLFQQPQFTQQPPSYETEKPHQYSRGGHSGGRYAGSDHRHHPEPYGRPPYRGGASYRGRGRGRGQ